MEGVASDFAMIMLYLVCLLCSLFYIRKMCLLSYNQLHTALMTT